MKWTCVMTIALLCRIAGGQIKFIDVTEESGLPFMHSARLTFTDLNNDGRADVVAREGDRYRVFINHADEKAKFGFRFDELATHGLPQPSGGDLIVFADLDNDGFPDAIFSRYLDLKNPKFVAPTTQPTVSSWWKGNGDGTFARPQSITSATQGTTACIAVGDANTDGLPDIAIGNWYNSYGESLTAYPTDLLMQQPDHSFVRTHLPEDDAKFDEDHDLSHRPTYGILFVRLQAGPSGPGLLQLNYGRRWNRLYLPTKTAYEDRAPQMHLDGDAIRHGKYPDWLKERAKTHKRFNQEDEKPFRSNGNNFDAAVGDVDGDGLFDFFFTEITHAWAGESADRSRFLLQRENDFVYDPNRSVDRDGTHDPDAHNWNQGDLFASLQDLDHDGKLDLILCSSDYPDPKPHENKLRFYHQETDGSFKDVTDASGVEHLGAQQPSWADLDGDGAMDLLVGQSFNRFTKEMIDARTPPGPIARIYLNRSQFKGKSIELRLVGDPTHGVSRSPFNAIVTMTTGTTRQMRQFFGPGGHNGKGGDLILHFGLGDAAEADEITVDWPGTPQAPTVLHHVKPGFHSIKCGE